MSVGMSGYNGVGVTHMTGQVLRFRKGVVTPPPYWTTPPPVTTTLSPTTTAAPTTLPPTTTATPTTLPPTTTASPTTPPPVTTGDPLTTPPPPLTTEPDATTTSDSTTSEGATPPPVTTDAATTEGVTTTPGATTAPPATTTESPATTAGGNGCCPSQVMDGPFATQEEAEARLGSGALIYRPCAAEPSPTAGPTTTGGCAHCSGATPSKVWVEIGGVTGDCARANGNWECEHDGGCGYSAQTSNGTVTVAFMSGGIGVTYEYSLSSGSIYWLNSASAPADCCAEAQVAFHHDSGDCEGAGDDSTCIIRPQCAAVSSDDPAATSSGLPRCASNDLGCSYVATSVVEVGGLWYVVGQLASDICCEPTTAWAGDCGTTGGAGCCPGGLDRTVSNWASIQDAWAYGKCHPIITVSCNSYSPGGCDDPAAGCVFQFERALDYRQEYSTTYSPQTSVLFARYRLICENCNQPTTTPPPTTTPSATTTIDPSTTDTSSTSAAQCLYCNDVDPQNVSLTISGVTCSDGDANGAGFVLSGFAPCNYEYFNPWGIWDVQFGDGYIEVRWTSASRNGGVSWLLELTTPYSCCASREVPFLSDWGTCEGSGENSVCALDPLCS